MFTGRAVWEVFWERRWREGREDELGPKGMQYLRDRYGGAYEPEPEDTYSQEDYDSDYEY